MTDDAVPADTETGTSSVYAPAFEHPQPYCCDCLDDLEDIDCEWMRCPSCGATWSWSRSYGWKFSDWTDADSGEPIKPPERYRGKAVIR